MRNLRRAVPLFLLFFVGALVAESRKIHDELGREVTVPDHPHRLICLAPSITDTVYELGGGVDIAGITDYTKYPPEAAQKPSVGGVTDPSLEKLASLRPDLVLAIGDLNSSDLIRSIEQMGFPVFVVRPHGIEGIYRSVESIGEAINRRPNAASLVARLRNRERAVRERAAGKKPPSVFFLLWADPVMTAGHGAFITELIEIAGGTSITHDLGNEWPRVSLETVIARQPEYVLLVKGSAVTLEGLQKQTVWRNLDAIAKGRVLYVDDRINFPSPLAFDALEDLAKQLHP
jgi:ABC-type Fe3+-hydroxamate transport system substrate-binding protein